MLSIRARFAAWRQAGMMAELGHELTLAGLALRRLPSLLRAPGRELFRRYYLLAGAECLGGVAVRATLLGALIVGYVVNVLAADAEAAIRLLQTVVLREVAPLFAALIVMTKAGIELTGQFIRMRERGEIEGLRLLGISPQSLLAVPCVAGVAAATLLLTLYVVVLAVGGGLVISSLVSDLAVMEMAERFLLQFHVGDLVLALGKGLLFGLTLGAVACHHGLTAPLQPQRISRAVMQSLFLVSLESSVLAYLAHGVLFFGVVR